MDIKPFSEDITTEGEIEASPEANQSQIKPFSDGISINGTSVDDISVDDISVNQDLTAREKKMLASVPENKKAPGFAGYYEKEQRDVLLKMGFSKNEISDVEKLYRSEPGTGYIRYTDPKTAPEGSDANVVIKTWGFADIDKDGFMHPDISYAENEIKTIADTFQLSTIQIRRLANKWMFDITGDRQKFETGFKEISKISDMNKTAVENIANKYFANQPLNDEDKKILLIGWPDMFKKAFPKTAKQLKI